jgi:putative PEP-CTERM system histidine kinase
LQTIIAIQVLVLLEVIYRQSGDNKWALKPLILYLAVLSILDFVTFANALMVEQIHFNYIAARGYIYFALIPFLILAIRRVKNWGVEIYISREVVMHSTLLMVAGGYLFVMGMIGYAVKYMGGEWGPTIQIVLIVLSLALLATLFLSLSFRTSIKVFITKHFFANQFDYRHEWVRLTHCLNTKDPEGNVYATALKGLAEAINYQKGCFVQYKNGELGSVTTPGWEFTSRYSQFELIEESREAQVYSMGVNYTVNEKLKLMADYIKAKQFEVNNESDFSNAVSLRVQYSF